MQTLEINKEIIMEKDNLVLGLSPRETIFGGIGIAIIAGGYMLLSGGGMGLQAGSWLAILAGIPFFLLGFYKKNGLVLEKYVAAIVSSKFTVPRKRPVSYPNEQYNLLTEKVPDEAEKNTKGKKQKNGEDTISQKRPILRKS